MTDELTPDDAAALSALYREASDDAEPPGEWSSLRDLIGAARESGFDEEPSPRIDALLMAAARKHAPEPKRSWWARLAGWMKPVVLHPAMAGAAALVVVAGAAGVMYRRGDGEVARPAPPAERPAVATHDGAGTGATVREQQQAPVPEAVATVTLPPAVAVTPPAPDPRPAGTKPDLKLAAPKPVPGGTGGGKQGETRERPPSSDRWSVGGADSDDGVGSFTVSQNGVTSETLTAEDSVGGAPPPAPPPAPPQSAPTGPSTTTTPEEERPAVRAPEATTSDVPTRDALMRDARAAARRGDCVSVASMSNRVRALDAAYHRDVFVRDPDVAACLTKKP